PENGLGTWGSRSILPRKGYGIHVENVAVVYFDSISGDVQSLYFELVSHSHFYSRPFMYGAAPAGQKSQFPYSNPLSNSQTRSSISQSSRPTIARTSSSFTSSSRTQAGRTSSTAGHAIEGLR
ncbi:MAG: hypothetical protein QGG09_22640, partial [Pirellulaceae bacterium]|nr:hypothetical protein [Pirellulaceae bacterium]